MTSFSPFPNGPMPRPQPVFFVTLPNGNVLAVPPQFAPRPVFPFDLAPIVEPHHRPAAEIIHPPSDPAPRFLRDADGHLYERRGDRIQRIDPAPVDPEPVPETPVLKPLLEGQPIRRLLRFGDWRPLLSGLVQQPERLGDAHQVPCDLTVFELASNTDAESLARASAAPFAPLDRAAAQKLGLARLAPAADPRPSNVPHHFKGERFFSARIVQDPTADPAPNQPRASQPRSAQPALRNRIPNPFLKPWEFRRSRHDAVIALQNAAAPPSWRARLARFLLRDQHNAAFDAWRRALAGRPLDEQLWAVPPPAGALSHPDVRRWAAETLAAARYDVPKMLNEWQLFWTRKGN